MAGGKISLCVIKDLPFSTFAQFGGEWSASSSGRFICGERVSGMYQLDMNLGGPERRLWCRELLITVAMDILNERNKRTCFIYRV